MSLVAHCFSFLHSWFLSNTRRWKFSSQWQEQPPPPPPKNRVHKSLRCFQEHYSHCVCLSGNERRALPPPSPHFSELSARHLTGTLGDTSHTLCSTSCHAPPSRPVISVTSTKDRGVLTQQHTCWSPWLWLIFAHGCVPWPTDWRKALEI